MKNLLLNRKTASDDDLIDVKRILFSHPILGIPCPIIVDCTFRETEEDLYALYSGNVFWELRPLGLPLHISLWHSEMNQEELPSSATFDTSQDHMEYRKSEFRAWTLPRSSRAFFEKVAKHNIRMITPEYIKADLEWESGKDWFELRLSDDAQVTLHKVLKFFTPSRSNLEPGGSGG